MSEIKLNLRDVNRAIHTTIHGSRTDYFVAALSADPETIEELQAALARFLPDETIRNCFGYWRSGIDAEPWDAGVCIIDLAARLVVIKSTYSNPGRRDGVVMTDSRKDREVVVPYHVADDWLFTDQVESWEHFAEQRRQSRLAVPRIDERTVLYGEVCRFIAESCQSEATAAEPAAADDDVERQRISAIHARWLMTPRADLNGLAPRDVLLARRDHMNWDLQNRGQQWSLLGACPPGLHRESAAYRYSGFGTHEIVVYYELVRFLIWDCWQGRGESGNVAAEVSRLEAVREEWLETPNPELSGRTPASIIDHERSRLPEGTTGAHAMVDCDCPICQMMADDPGPYFWHLDGCNMDDDFAFSFHRTRAEWEAKQREYEEFNRRFDEEQRARKAAGTDSIWQSSYVNPDIMGTSAELALFGLAAHLGELMLNLKDAGAEQTTIDELNRVFGNIHAAVQDQADALIEPVIERMNETLAALAETHPGLAEKCADLERQLTAFGRRLADEPCEDDELPF